MSYKKLETVAVFPPGTFLENVVVRKDYSFILTSHITNELYYVPAGQNPIPTPTLIHKFKHNILGIVETKPDIFYISASSNDVPGSSALWRLDMNGFSTSDLPKPTKALDLPAEAKWLNGSCLLSSEKSVVLLADSWAHLIWAVDLSGTEPFAKVWLKHDSMNHDPEGDWAAAPGINGVHFNPADGHVYWTNSTLGTFVRVKVNGDSLLPVGEVEVVAKNLLSPDDFIIDQKTNGAYITFHAFNMVEWVSLDGQDRKNVEGQAGVNTSLIGPTAAAWGRRPGDEGHVFYVTTEGGMVVPHEGSLKEARLLRFEV